MNVNEVIAHRANEILGEGIAHPNGHVNMSQSSNDTFPTAMHIAAFTEIEGNLLPALAKFEETLTRLEKENTGIVKTGRTHLQDAVPIAFSQEISAWREMIAKAQTNISQSLEGLRELRSEERRVGKSAERGGGRIVG